MSTTVTTGVRYSGKWTKIQQMQAYAAGTWPGLVELWGWGDNTLIGQQSSPVQLGAATQWSTLTSTSEGSKMAIKTDGSLWSWGVNNFGQLGQNSTVGTISSPVQVGTSYDWAGVAGGEDQVLAYKKDGTLWAWGLNSNGELGLNDVVNRSSPVQVGLLTTWAAVGCGYTSSMAIKVDGTIWSWGDNPSGQLGLGDIVDRSSPVQIGILTNWSSVSGGRTGALAIKTDGSLWAWGGSLTLGNAGITTNRSSPIQVGALTSWLFSAGGYNYAGGISGPIGEGNLYMWGINTSSVLGIGNTTTYRSPKQVTNLTGWTSVYCSHFFSGAIGAEGTLWMWGENGDGQLGIGNTIDKSFPVQVGSRTKWSQLAITSGVSNGATLALNTNI